MARLPVPGGDDGNWGVVLNDYLRQSHADDGMLLPEAVSSALGVASATDGQVLTVDATNQGGVRWRNPASVSIPDATTTSTGGVRLAGDLSGTAMAPTVPGLAAKANSADVYSRSQIDSVIATKANSADVYSRSQIDSAMATKADIANVYTRAQVDNALASKQDANSLAAVATSGSYNDLSDRPAIPQQFNPIAGNNVTLTGTYPNITIAAASGATNLSTTTTPNDATVVSSTGNDATIGGATATNAGVMTAADKAKLDNVADGATANSSDAQLRDRSTHTGTQNIATIAGLQSALDGKADSSALGAKADTSTTITGTNSLTGGGDLSANRTLELVNDTATPGNSRYYGTNDSGTKGYHDLPTGAAPATTTELGTVQLAGDLSGTATAPTVSGVRGIGFSATAPAAGQMLVADSPTSASWQSNTFVSGDGIANIVKLTQTAYDALPTRDPETLYVIQN